MARWNSPRGYVEDVAAATALAVVDDRASGQGCNLCELVAHTEAEWVRLIGEAVGWKGEVVTVPSGRSTLPFDAGQSLDTDTDRIREELEFAEVVTNPDYLAKLTIRQPE